MKEQAKTPEDVMRDLMMELMAAASEHKTATEAEALASKETTRATNRLNNAQRAVDKHMAEMRKNAPWNTEWSSRRGQAVETA